MKTKIESTAQQPQDLLNDLHALVAEAERMVSNAATETSDDAISALRQRFESARERLADFYADARQKVVAGARSADEAIRANPYQSLAVALGAGLLVGVLLGRRSR